MFRNKRGFTLVEIMAIVGILAAIASITLASMNEARKSARDKQRVTDLQTIKLALRLYKEKYNSYKPTAAMASDGTSNGYVSAVVGNATKSLTQVLYDEGLIPKTTIEDPTLGVDGYYIHYTNELSYTLCAIKEKEIDTENTFADANCGGVTTYNYAINSSTY